MTKNTRSDIANANEYLGTALIYAEDVMAAYNIQFEMWQYAIGQSTAEELEAVIGYGTMAAKRLFTIIGIPDNDFTDAFIDIIAGFAPVEHVAFANEMNQGLAALRTLRDYFENHTNVQAVEFRTGFLEFTSHNGIRTRGLCSTEVEYIGILINGTWNTV